MGIVLLQKDINCIKRVMVNVQNDGKLYDGYLYHNSACYE